MSTETAIILVGIGVALLAILMLRLGKRLAIGLLILGGLAVIGTAALSMLTQASATRETAIAAQRAAEAAQTAAAGQAMTSAATSITLFLVALLLVLVLTAGGAALAWSWWQKQQKHRNTFDLLRQAQLYTLLNGQPSPTLRSPRVPRPQTYNLPTTNDPLVVMPAQQIDPYLAYSPTPALPQDNSSTELARSLIRALELVQSLQGYRGQEPYSPLTNLLPPDGVNAPWEELG